jgi:hypothetical protein
MPAKTKTDKSVSKTDKRISKPAQSPEAREKQLVNLAVELAEKQLRDGTAAPSVINHFLKIASSREAIERDILEKQSRLIEAKASSINKDREAEDLAKAAIEAMKNYNAGQ